MDIEEVIKWLMIMKANLNSFPEVSNAKKIEALAEAIRLLKNEQSKEPRWIPVSERLPEEAVLACNMYGCMMIGMIYEDGDSGETGYTVEDNGGCLMNDVVAWQPLPKVYKAESEE